MEAFPEVQSLIPHAGPSCLLAAVQSFTPTHTECRAIVDASHPYLAQGSVHTLLAIELFAQAAAVHRALSTKDANGPVALGTLAAAQAEVYVDRLEPPLTLRVRVGQGHVLGSLHSFQGELFSAGDEPTLLATGEITVSIGGTEVLVRKAIP